MDINLFLADRDRLEGRMIGRRELVREAITQLARVGALVVVDEATRPVGVLTEHDVLRGLLHKDKSVLLQPVVEIMSKDVFVAKEHRDDLLTTAIDFLVMGPFRILPVVDPEGKLVAAITAADLLRLLKPILREGLRRVPRRGGILDYLGALYP